MKESQDKNLKLIYLACGSQSDIKRFTTQAAKLGLTVTTKYQLLESDPAYADTLEELEVLSWDQQALVDYMVMLRSSHFVGTWASSFAWNIVFRRHVAVGGGTWTHSALALETGVSKWKRKLREGECYRDDISTIFGPPRMGIWFELSMWP